jgi:HEAT repeat protein
VSVNEKIVAYHVARLKDRSAEIRLKSIHELSELGDPAALDALQQTFRTDDNLEVRKAAQDAGRAIFLKTQRK